ncbi:MAG TPA: MFS transporter, partial [Ktedonobacteraceae bacterium]|nr:MFS transporter [Ktedonobacteraceae bacterium]
GREEGAGRFDPAGFLLAGLGLALFMYALTEGPSYGWSSPNILITFFAGLALLGVFIAVELRVKEPMLDLRLFGERLFRTCNLVTLFSSAGFLGLLFAVPLFLQEGQGVSPLLSGLTTFPEALGVVTSSQIVTLFYAQIGPRRLAASGLALVTVTMSLFFLVGLQTDLWVTRLLMFLTGVGMGCTFIPVNTASFANISHAATGRASALSNAQRQIGSALGIALVSTMLGIVGLTTVDAHGIVQPNLNAYHIAFVTSAVLALIASGISLTIRDRDAASTMQPEDSVEKGASLEMPMVEI